MNITVYIPDELGKRLEENKGKLNLSQTFQQALREELNDLTLENDSSDKLARLRASKKKSDRHWFREGKTDGMEWALEADYDIVSEVARLADLVNRGVDNIATELHNAMKDTGWTWGDIFGEGGEEVPNFEAYARGWIEGVEGIFMRL
jgi:hypothetical protein